MLKYFTTNIQKPIIVFAVDNSKSIILSKDSTEYKNNLQNKINEITEKLSANNEIYKYSFGNNANILDTIKYNEATTNFSNLFDYIQSNCSNKNVGAIVLISDGIYNSGANPEFIQTGINCPLYTVLVGDTNTNKDLSIENVLYNKIVFLDNTFNIKINVRCYKFKGESCEIKIYNNNTIVGKSITQISTDNILLESLFELKAEKEGIQHFKIVITNKKGEQTYLNNTKDLIIEVLKSKQKILLLTNSPHPDAGAIKSALETNPNYELTFDIAGNKNYKSDDYNLIILNQLPSKNNAATQVIKDAIDNKVPLLYLIGSQTSVNLFNKLSTGLQINQVNSSFDEVYPLLNNNFTNFQLTDDFQNKIKNFQPLVVPFGEYKYSPNATVLLFQKVKNVSTSKPLFLFFENYNETRTGIICGEGLWRWKLKDYQENSNHETFNELINKIIQYLSVKIKKQKFIVNSKNVYPENEPVVIGAELYNDNFEPVNSPDVNIDITNNNKKFTYVFSKSGQFYSLNTGTLNAGEYSYNATTKLGDKSYSKSGKFFVSQLNIESSSLVANKELMEQLALKNNGKLFNYKNIDDLLSTITNNKNITSVSYSDKKLNELINFKYLFFALILLLSFEWFIRKLFGSY